MGLDCYIAARPPETTFEDEIELAYWRKNFPLNNWMYRRENPKFEPPDYFPVGVEVELDADVLAELANSGILAPDEINPWMPAALHHLEVGHRVLYWSVP